MAVKFDTGFLALCIRLLPNGMEMGDEEAREKLLEELLNDALTGPTARIATLDLKKLAHRELPPGNWAQLYLLFQAFCLANETACASKAVFYRATKPWRKVLKFRPVSKHSICEVCDKLKSKMRHSTCFVDHAAAADQLLGHLRLTWQCRSAYWNAREMSRAHQDVLCLIFDGYDKSKPVVPRWAHGRAPKNAVMERVNRTHISVSAILAHGYGALVYLSEEGNTAGGEFSWECLLHAIDCCRDEDRARGRPSAKCLWTQHDNTVKELKNSLTGCMLAALVQSGYFDEAGSHQLMVGHTHEDVDGLFGLITSHLFAAGERLQTVHDFRRLLEARVGPVFESRGEFLKVVLLDRVRPWKTLMPKVATLDNAYRPRKNEVGRIPHSFVFRRRRDLPPAIPKSERLPRRYAQSPNDVFALVKHNLCDTDLAQPALLVLPGDEKARMDAFWQTSVRHAGILAHLDPERAQDLLELSQALDVYPQFSRAAKYLRSLAGAEYRQRLPVQPLNFLARGGVEPQGLVCANLPPRQQQPDPHQLRVHFHRRQ